MSRFFPESGLYVFVGVVSALFIMMTGCIIFHKRKTYMKKPFFKKNATEKVKRRTRRNKFLMKRGERADADEEGGTAEGQMDKIRAEIDAKYNNQIVWSTIASGDSPSAGTQQSQNDTEETIV